MKVLIKKFFCSAALWVGCRLKNVITKPIPQGCGTFVSLPLLSLAKTPKRTCRQLENRVGLSQPVFKPRLYVKYPGWKSPLTRIRSPHKTFKPWCMYVSLFISYQSGRIIGNGRTMELFMWMSSWSENVASFNLFLIPTIQETLLFYQMERQTNSSLYRSLHPALYKTYFPVWYFKNG